MATILNAPELVEGRRIEACPSCRSRNLTKLGGLPEAFHFCSFRYRHPVNRGDLMRCEQCSLQFRSPCLEEATLTALYQAQPSDVWGFAGEQRTDFPFIVKAISTVAAGRLSILDVGCFTGGLLLGLKQALEGERAVEVFGLEPSKAAADFAREKGVQILGATTADLAKTQRSFEAIVFTDVFEHVLSVQAMIAQAADVLSPGGVLIVVTGAADSRPFAATAQRYYYSAMPEHLVFLSRAHATWMADALGLELVSYEFVHHYREAPWSLKIALRNLAHRLAAHLPTRAVSASNPLVGALARVRGLGIRPAKTEADHAVLVLRRPGA